MTRHRSTLVQVVAVTLILLTTSAALWLSVGASATYAATCGGNNSVCVTPIPTVASTLNGKNQTISYTLTFALSTNANSWHVTILPSQYTTGGSSPHVLPTTASTVTVVCQGSPCTAFPNNNVSYPFQMTAGNTYNLCNATSNGKGSFQGAATIKVAVPGGAYSGTYTSTITLALVTGGP